VLSNGATIATKGASILHKQVTCSNGTDTDHDMDFTAGNFQFDDGTGQASISALTKRFDATFTLDASNGGMVSGESLPTDGTVYIYMISNASGSITNIIGTTTADGSTISGDSVVITHSMTKKRKLAALVTDGSGNIRRGNYMFFRGGYEFWFIHKTAFDYSANNPGTSRVTVPLLIPPILNIKAIFNFWFKWHGNTGERYAILRSELDADSSVSSSNFDFRIGADGDTVNLVSTTLPCESGNITFKLLTSDENVSINIKTKGWTEYLI